MAETTIEWTATRMPDGTMRPGYTFNPWIGCTKVHEGCRHCYAEADFDKRRKRVRWGPSGTRVMTTPAYWRKPIAWNKAAAVAGVRDKVFCASLADVFEAWKGPIHDSKGEQLFDLGDGIYRTGAEINQRAWPGFNRVDPLYWLDLDELRFRLFELIQSTPHLDWLILTKRPENIRRMWTKWYIDEAEDCPEGYEREAFRQGKVLERIDNVWLLTSVSDQASADKQIIQLTKCRELSPVLGISAEPLLGPIETPLMRYLDWVIAGGESGHGARPMHPDWARSVRDQCQAAGVPFHFKQWGEWAPHMVPPVRGQYTGAGVFMLPSGHLGEQGDWWDGKAQAMDKVGKKAAGRILDGRTWDEFPAVGSAVTA